MRRLRTALPGLTGLALLGFLALGCGQNEGGRCQVDSDCGSGLECTRGETGNGICKQPGSAVEQPALPDGSPDLTPATPDLGPDSAEPDAAVASDTEPTADDASPSEAGADDALGPG